MLKDKIEEKLKNSFAPTYLRVDDDSALHAGHSGAIPGKSTHFRVRIISDVFCELSRIERHKKVYACLNQEFKSGLHAFQLETLCPQEVQEE